MRPLLVLLLACCALPAQQAEILWDRWGVPHVYASDSRQLFRAYGWAQMHSHANLLLKLYGEARGRAAEYWGPQHLDQDRWFRTNGVPRIGEQWWSRQTPEFRKLIESYVDGVNAYAKAHPEAIAPENRAVLPATPEDTMRHALRVVHMGIVGPANMKARVERDWNGSNGWAIGPARSQSGKAMLLINPHLEWGGSTTYYEAHLVAPGVDVSGAAQVGIPVIRLGFNNDLGWMTTVNPIDSMDLYELELVGDGYRWNGAVAPFESETVTLKVKQPDGSFTEDRTVIRRSVHGPVIVTRNNKAIALRMAGLDQPWMLDQYWAMARSRNRKEFEAQLQRLQIPAYNVIYADRQGGILHLFNGRVPKRPPGNYPWEWVVPGTTSATLWTETHAYADLPKVVDPPSGWLQNANDPPWLDTLPPVLDPAKFPGYMAPRFFQFRAQSSLRLLRSTRKLSFDELTGMKHSTRVELAEHMLHDLIDAARSSSNEKAKQAAQVLAGWDRMVSPGSKGAVLFEAFVRTWTKGNEGRLRLEPGENGLFASPWDRSNPVATPRGIADPGAALAALAQAAGEVEKEHKALDVPWGDVFRVRAGGVDLPANGGPGSLGVFRTLNFRRAPDGRFAARHGDSYVAMVEFSTPIRARALLSYGNASQPGSKHVGDQLPFLSRNELRPAYRTRKEVEANLEKRELLP